MKIEFVTYMFLPQSTGGTQVYTNNIARALQDSGHQVSLFAGDLETQQPVGSPRLHQVDYDGLLLNRLQFSWGSRSAYYGPQLLFNPDVYQVTVDHWQENRPDLIHVTYCGHFSAAPLQAAVDLGIPVVMTATDYWLICPIGTLLKRDDSLCMGRQSGTTCQQCIHGDTRVSQLMSYLPPTLQEGIVSASKQLNRFALTNGAIDLIGAVEARNGTLPKLLNQVDLLFTPSRFMKDTLVAAGLINHERVHVFPHGHNIQRAMIGKHKSCSDKIRFGYTSNLAPIKGAHILIQAFRELQTDSASLTIYGNPNSYPDYAVQCRALAQDDPRIVFAGAFNNERIGEILQDIDVLVVPSLWYENAPVTIAEAFVAKTPLIVTDLGGMAEAVEADVNGLRFPLGDANRLAQQMQRFLDEPGLVQRFRLSIPEVRSVQDEADALEGIYRQLIQGVPVNFPMNDQVNASLVDKLVEFA
ncbi:MAG: glycosyltransferase family 4 protein [Chloroflexota bacterium]